MPRGTNADYSERATYSAALGSPGLAESASFIGAAEAARDANRLEKGVSMKTRLLSALATSLVGAAVAVGQAPPAVQVPGSGPATPEVVPAAAPACAQPAAPMIFPREGIPLFADPNPLEEPVPEKKRIREELVDKGDGFLGCVWVSADYLLWWIKDAPAPVPLVATGPVSSSGLLGAPGTSVVFGGGDIGYGAISGTRFSFGFCDSCYECGLEVSGFYLPGSSTTSQANSTPAGSPVLSRPFVDLVAGGPGALLIAFPGAFAGGVVVDSSFNMWGAEANVLKHKLTHTWVGDAKPAGWSVSLDGLAGIRFINFNEHLSVYQQSTVLPGGVTGFNGARISAPSAIAIGDRFDTTNDFYGAQVGLMGQVMRGRFFSSMTGKFALGSTYQVSNINGFTSLLGPTAPIATTAGGLLALPSNIGLHSRSAFSYVPELGVNAGYEVTKHVRAYVGYTFLYWSEVLRPGDQMNPTITKTQLPSSLAFGPVAGPAQPIASAQPSNLWAQGFNAGFAIRY